MLHSKNNLMILLFFIICVVSAVGSLQPGLVNLSVVQTVTQRGLIAGFYVAFGGSLPEMLYAFLAIQIVEFGEKFTFIATFLPYIKWFTVIILIAISVYFFLKKAAKNYQISQNNDLNSYNNKVNYQVFLKAFLKGFLMGLSNFQLVFFWSVVFLYCKEMSITAMQKSENQFAFIVATGIGAFIFLCLLAMLTAKYQHKFQTVFNKSADKIMGFLCLFLVIITLLN
jgi:threonine/homoserine/homoserine lactone efflux protein